MKLKQITVFLENRRGRLEEALEALEASKINIRALAIADTSEFGILRLIVPDPDRAAKALARANFSVRETDVVAIAVDDRPGGLARALETLNTARLNLEYLYLMVGKIRGKAVVILRVENLAAAIKALRKGKVAVLPAREVLGA